MTRVFFVCVVLLNAYAVTIENTNYGKLNDGLQNTSSRRRPGYRSRERPTNYHPYEYTDYEDMPPPHKERVLYPIWWYGPVRPAKPRDKWPDRPKNIPGASKAHPLPKCCKSRFQLDGMMEKCVYGTNEFLNLTLNETNEEQFPSCDASDVLRLDAVRAVEVVRQTMDELLRLTVNKLDNSTSEVILERHEFCVDAATDNAGPFAILMCPCKHTVCVRKCCDTEKALVVDETSLMQVQGSCKDLPKRQLGPWKPRFDASSRPEEALGNRSGYVVLEKQWPTQCAAGKTRAPPSWATPYPGVDFKVFPNGHVSIRNNPNQTFINFCLDNEISANGSLVESIVYCASTVEVPQMDRWLSVLGILGAVALAVTVAAHVLLPEMRASPFGRALMSYAAALLLLALIGISWTLAPHVSRARCIFNITWTQYFLLVSAFWLNVMCYDIGIAFWSYTGSEARRGRKARRRFIRYSQYAWGCPLISVLPFLALQFTHPPGSPWRPIEWFMKCNYSHRSTHFLFLYLPILLLLLLNLCIFVWTAWKIRLLQKDSAILTDDEDSSEESLYPPRKRLLLFLKLLWVMGVLETLLEVIAWAGASEITHWHISNVVDLSRALCIFGLTCCKRKVLDGVRQQVRERMREPICWWRPRNNSVVPSVDGGDAAAAANDTDTSVFCTTTTQAAASEASVSQTPTCNANATQASTSNATATHVGTCNATAIQDGASKTAVNQAVIEEKAKKDNDPPRTIEMQVISTTTL